MRQSGNVCVDCSQTNVKMSKFYKDLMIDEMDLGSIIEKYFFNNLPYVFRDDEDLYFDLKKEISSFFNVSIKSVVIVGSSTIGYSINPQQLWSPFSEESDIDTVVISNDAFDIYWKQLYNVNISSRSRSYEEDRLYKKFLDYFFKGWLRPDLFPFRYEGRERWFKFFQGISYKKYYGLKVTGAIFRDEFFFKQYHMNNLLDIRRLTNNEQ